jgi:catechol 2,3-dioxygenase-like lactoylglutathione lyase family enzyme
MMLSASIASAQGSAQPSRATPFTASGAFFGLHVPDLEASAKWYEEKLGLKRIQTEGRFDRIAGLVVLEGGGLMVELIQHDQAVRPSGDAPMQGFFKSGVLVSDFDATVAALRSRGVPFVFGPFPARETQRANVGIRDNAGNLIIFLGGYARK